MSGRRLKLSLILVVIVASVLALLAWTQVWVHVTIAGSEPLAVPGATAAPALTALALAGFALAGALTIAGGVIRVILGVLEVTLGASVFLAAYLAVSDPAQASAAAVTAATGIAGSESTQGAVDSASLTFWPFLALIAAVIMVLAGALVVVTSGRWPDTRRRGTRFEPVTATDAAGPAAHAPGDPVSDWDDLSRGQDPT